MRTTLFRLISAVVVLGGAARLPLVAEEQAGSPKIDFADVTYDFGRLKQGDVVKHGFVFTNSGTALLEIRGVKPLCGCTVAGEWDRKVEPGKTGTIPLQFASAGFGGSVAKSAHITCNDPVHSNIVLTLKGTVWRPIDVNPVMTMFQMESEGQTNQTRVVKIVSNMDEPVTISEPTCPSKSFKPELKSVKPGKEWDLEITAVPPFVQPTTFATISLKTSCTQAPMLSATAYVALMQVVTVVPQQVTLPPGPLTNDVTSQVSIYFRGTNTLKLSDPQIEWPGARAEVKEVQPGKVFLLRGVFPAGFQVKPGESPHMTVKTDHPKHPQINVPIFQTALPPSAASVARAVPPKPAATPASGPPSAPTVGKQAIVRTTPPGPAAPPPLPEN